jgi:hypothetical protein
MEQFSSDELVGRSQWHCLQAVFAVTSEQRSRSVDGAVLARVWKDGEDGLR